MIVSEFTSGGKKGSDASALASALEPRLHTSVWQKKQPTIGFYDRDDNDEEARNWAADDGDGHNFSTACLICNKANVKWCFIVKKQQQQQLMRVQL